MKYHFILIFTSYICTFNFLRCFSTDLSSDEFIFFTNGTSIHRVTFGAENYTDEIIPLKFIRNAVAVDFDPINKLVYWSDIELNAIKRASVSGTVEEILAIAVSDGIAVDWITQNIFWTDSGQNCIKVARVNDNAVIEKLVVATDLSKPGAIVVDSYEGLIFWSDLGKNPKIERANQDGTRRISVVNTSLEWPCSLAIDYQNGKIYWGDAGRNVIEFANIDGTDRQTLVQNAAHIHRISLQGDFIYWINRARNSIEKANKYDGSNHSILYVSVSNLTGLKAADQVIRPHYKENSCGRRYGNCSHLCLNQAYPEGYSCVCHLGFELLDDKTTCMIQHVFLLVAHETGIKLASHKNNHSETVPVTSPGNITSIDMDIKNNKIYWTDISNRAIYSIFINGTGFEEVLDFIPKVPLSVCYDWMANNLYWTDLSTGTIEMTHVGSLLTKVLVRENINYPRTIIVDPSKGNIYWADWKVWPVIERASLDGTNRIVILRETGRTNGLTMDFTEQRLFWVNIDSNTIECADSSGKNRLSFYHKFHNPFGLALDEDHIYWTDRNRNTLHRCNKSTGVNCELVHDHLNGHSELMVYQASKQSGTNGCKINNGGCSHFCINHSERNTLPNYYHCECATNYKLALDNRTCIENSGTNDTSTYISLTLSPSKYIRAVIGDALHINCTLKGMYSPDQVWHVPTDYQESSEKQRRFKTRWIVPGTLELVVSSLKNSDTGSYSCQSPKTKHVQTIVVHVLSHMMSSEQGQGHYGGQMTCSHTQFRCASGLCIFLRFHCDRIVDCPDSSDEIGCDASCAGQFRCDNGQCINRELVCDPFHAENCRDGSDERYCRRYIHIPNPYKFSTTTMAPKQERYQQNWHLNVIYSAVAGVIGILCVLAIIVITVLRQTRRRALRQLFNSNRHNVACNLDECQIHNQQNCRRPPSVAINVNFQLQDLQESRSLIVRPPPYTEVEEQFSEYSSPPPYSTLDRLNPPRDAT